LKQQLGSFGKDKRQYSKGDVVVVVKQELKDGALVKSTVFGESATVEEPDWNGLVKVNILTGKHTGETKSYLAKFLVPQSKFQGSSLAGYRVPLKPCTNSAASKDASPRLVLIDGRFCASPRHPVSLPYTITRYRDFLQADALPFPPTAPQ
jgi:hypothetical protein